MGLNGSIPMKQFLIFSDAQQVAEDTPELVLKVSNANIVAR